MKGFSNLPPRTYNLKTSRLASCALALVPPPGLVPGADARHRARDGAGHLPALSHAEAVHRGGGPAEPRHSCLSAPGSRDRCRPRHARRSPRPRRSEQRSGGRSRPPSDSGGEVPRPRAVWSSARGILLRRAGSHGAHARRSVRRQRPARPAPPGGLRRRGTAHVPYPGAGGRLLPRGASDQCTRQPPRFHRHGIGSIRPHPRTSNLTRAPLAAPPALP